MQLAEDSFYSGQFNFRRSTDSPLESVPRYSYESKDCLYDTFVLDGNRYYLVNGQNAEKRHSPYFRAILNHFKVTP